MQLPKDMEVEMKSFRRKNKKESIMATTTLKPPRIKGFKETQAFIRDYIFQGKYGMSVEEFIEKAEDGINARLLEKTHVMAVEQAKVMAAEQAKVMAVEQAKVMAAEQIEQSIITMFKKTGWSAEKIADISGFPLEMVQKAVATLK
jgi:hypothetical protein